MALLIVEDGRSAVRTLAMMCLLHNIELKRRMKLFYVARLFTGSRQVIISQVSKLW